MITKSEKTEVRRYLASKKLPIDVIMEVEDHFTSQIESFQLRKDDTFYDAFYKTKLLWVKDFELVRKSWIAFGKVPRIVRELNMEETISLLKKATLLSFIFFILSFFVANSVSPLNFNHYLLFFNSLISVPIYGLVIFYMFSISRKAMVSSELYYYNQLGLFLLVTICLHLFQMYFNIADLKMYDIFTNSIHESSLFTIGYTIFKDIVTNIIGINFLLFLINRFKAKKKIKNYQLA